MPRKQFFLLCLFILGAIDAVSAQAAARQDTTRAAQSQPWGTWSAKSSTGLVLMGTWTAVPDTTRGTVTGTWALVDPQGKTLAGGGWSAAKSPTEWTGAWRATVTGREGEYSGTWTASVDLRGEAGFTNLFEKAVTAIVSGTWRSGGNSGGWSIRAAKPKAGP